MLSLVSASLALLVLAIGGASLTIWEASVALVVWGGAIAAVLVGLQTWILKEAGPNALPASAIYVALFNGAIGLGAMIGGAVLNSASSAAVFLAAALFVALGTLAIHLLREPMSNEPA